MASLQMQSNITKPRNRMVVKPLLKKLHSHSDRESLDLDRDWDHQPTSRQLDYHHYTHHSSPKSPRDLSFSLSPSDFDATAAALASAAAAAAAAATTSTTSSTTAISPTTTTTTTTAARAPARSHNFSHARSASAASHASIATSNSGRNGGSFVHPFQQTPQGTSLAYAHSRASLDIVRDCSPTITEDDDDDRDPYSAATVLRPVVYHHRRSSLASQPPSSLSDANNTTTNNNNNTSPLYAVASRSNSGSVQRLALGSANQSRSELQLSAGASLVDSPVSATAPAVMSLPSPQVTAAPSRASSAAGAAAGGPMSPLRSSLDVGGFRLRSRSELDPVSRQEQVRAARRKFEAKERAKEEKYVRKRERANQQKLEREQARVRSASHASLSSGAGSGRLSRSAPTPAPAPGVFETDEKSARTHDASSSSRFRHSAQPTRADDVEFKSARRTRTAKQRTMGVWTAFMLWLRTRLLKLGRR